MYDPMVAKLIVWDVDRERATAHAARARRVRDRGLKTLIPFHKALLATEQWAQGGDVPRPRRGQEWLKTLALPKPRRSRPSDEAETVEQTYTVEVSGRRFDVRVIGAADGRRRQRRRARAGAASPRARASARGAAAPAAPTTLHLAAAGQHVEGDGREGRDGRGGPAALHHRGDEDGERDHRPQGGHDRGAPDHRGRRDPSGDPIAVIKSTAAVQAADAGRRRASSPAAGRLPRP